jgi:S1-C subfamily serine protease
MRANALGLLVMVCLAANAPAQATLNTKVLTRVKAATVFIRVSAWRGESTGSGFVIDQDGDAALVLTNHHVLFPDDATRTRPIEIVFHSGTSREVSRRAEYLASDPDADLALVRVARAPEGCDPFEFATGSLLETTTVYALGYPFGTAIEEREGNPSITVTRGSVTSCRVDEYGNLSKVQIDADVNPGNSGGPVVLADGHVIGVVATKVLATQIGFVIPPASVKTFLDGRILSARTEVVSTLPDLILVRFSAKVIDPLGKIEDLAVVTAPEDDVAGTDCQREDGRFDPMARDLERHDLKLKDGEATGTVLFKRGTEEFRIELFQFVYESGGTTYWTGPAPLQLDFTRVDGSGPGSSSEFTGEDLEGDQEDEGGDAPVLATGSVRVETTMGDIVVGEIVGKPSSISVTVEGGLGKITTNLGEVREIRIDKGTGSVTLSSSRLRGKVTIEDFSLETDQGKVKIKAGIVARIVVEQEEEGGLDLAEGGEPEPRASGRLKHLKDIGLDTTIIEMLALKKRPMVLVATGEQSLLLIGTRDDKVAAEVMLHEAPTCICINPAETYAYVGVSTQGHNSYSRDEDERGKVVIVDLKRLKVKSTADVQVDPFDIEATNQHVFIASGSGQWTSMAVYDRLCRSLYTRWSIRHRSLLGLNHKYELLYSTTTDLSPQDIDCYEIDKVKKETSGSSRGIRAAYDSPYHGELGGFRYGFRISPEGKRIFLSSGKILTSSTVRQANMTIRGELGFQWIDLDFVNSDQVVLLDTANHLRIVDVKEQTSIFDYPGENVTFTQIELPGDGQKLYAAFSRAPTQNRRWSRQPLIGTDIAVFELED